MELLSSKHSPISANGSVNSDSEETHTSSSVKKEKKKKDKDKDKVCVIFTDLVQYKEVTQRIR